jgi:hypothetical protein
MYSIEYVYLCMYDCTPATYCMYIHTVHIQASGHCSYIYVLYCLTVMKNINNKYRIEYCMMYIHNTFCIMFASHDSSIIYISYSIMYTVCTQYVCTYHIVHTYHAHIMTICMYHYIIWLVCTTYIHTYLYAVYI